jgi:hypothetical protein
MTFDELKDMWQADSVIGKDLSDEALSTPALHAKYLSLLMDLKAFRKNAEMALYEIQRSKVRYYKGEMSAAELEEAGWKQYQGTKPLRSDLEELIKTDPEVVKKQNKVDYLTIQIDFLTEVLKMINNRQWLIRSSIDWQKFQAGV